MKIVSINNYKKINDKLSEWLNKDFTFTHFISLATNQSNIRPQVMRAKLRDWDARMNRRIYGPKWRKHHDELLFWFGFVEKPRSNPHWHLVLKLMEPNPDKRGIQAALLETWASPIWQKLVPSGSVKVEKITEEHGYVMDYVAKELGYELQYQKFITPDEFRRF